MIWYSEQIRSQQQPEETTITLSGIFNPPGSGQHMIILRAEIEMKPGDTLIIKTLYEKTPATFGAIEEPNPDDVQAKYYRHVLKARDKISKTNFQDILNW